MLKRMGFSSRMLLIVATAVVMAYISAKLLFNGSALNTIPWGVLALAASFLATSKKEAWKLGAGFGFVVSYSFLWFDDSGTKTLAHVLILIPLVVVPSLFGALCGLLATWLGWQLQPRGESFSDN